MKKAEYLALLKKVLNANGYYFFRDVNEVWSGRFTDRELQTLKLALLNKDTKE